MKNVYWGPAGAALSTHKSLRSAFSRPRANFVIRPGTIAKCLVRRGECTIFTSGEQDSSLAFASIHVNVARSSASDAGSAKSQLCSLHQIRSSACGRAALD